MSALDDAIDELRTLMANYDARLRGPIVPPTAPVVSAARHVLSCATEQPEPTIPEGKVLVDETDLRVVERWLNRYGLCRHAVEGRVEQDDLDDDAWTALQQIVALLPAPSWEPSEEQVRAYIVKRWTGAALDNPDTWASASRDLKAAHAAGLLSPEVTGGYWSAPHAVEVCPFARAGDCPYHRNN